MKNLFCITVVCAAILAVIPANAQKTGKYSQEIIIDCQQVPTAKMSSDGTISGKVKDIDITFPHKTLINPKKGAVILFKAPGYNQYKLMVPPGGIESEFMLHFTENSREKARQRPTYTREEIVQESSSVENKSDDPTIPQNSAKEMVSRDNPGNTTLEKTIIRWAFDSDPQGARVYWRVISSIPEQVKNTNETYLMTTPYEETRAFNILGLTYENSRDVTIEVKVTKQGYYPQVKRFNVRQAIDQQEVSSFFDLVKTDE